MKQAFSMKMRERMNMDVRRGWQELYMDTAKEVFGGGRRGPRKQWISERTLQLVAERNRLKEDLNCDPVRALDRYRAAAKDVKKSARDDKKTFMNNMAESAEEAARRHDTRTLYRKVRRLRANNGTRTQLIMNLDGTILTSEQDQMNR